MSDTQQKKKRQLPSILDPYKMFDGIDTEPGPPYLVRIKATYPDVPEPHYLTWDHSDQHTRKSSDWQAALSKAKSALVAAAKECDALAAADEPTRPKNLLVTANRLKSSIYRTEDILSSLSGMYPLPDTRNTSYTTNPDGLHEYTPKLLSVSSEQIIIWLPVLPPKNRNTNSHLFTSFRELLRSSDLPQLVCWHCDFIHVFQRPRQGLILGARDVDNYPYKPIIDALASSLKTHDSAFQFSCGMYNILSDRIDSGCYIRITDRSQKVGFWGDFENLISSLK